jgi:putative nucleotidyltransferase with HDIG domain
MTGMQAQPRIRPHDFAALVGYEIEIPAMPTIAQLALEEISKPRASMAQVTNILNRDQGLSLQVLKIANSAAFGLVRGVKSLQQAATIIGFEVLKSVIITAAARRTYKRFGPVEQELWSHSLMSAIGAQCIARMKKIAFANDAFLSGLLHDVGRVIMNNNDPERFKQVLALERNEDLDEPDAEQRIAHYTHCEVGALLASRWKLPDHFETVILFHHEPDTAVDINGPLSDLLATVVLASRMNKALPLCELPEGEGPSDLAWALERLKIAHKDIGPLAAQVDEMYQREKAVFS